MTFLLKKRTQETYFDKISTKSKSLQNTTRIVLEQFDKFCIAEYSHDSEQVIRELIGMEIDECEQATCDVYQSWINWNYNNKISPKTLKVYFSLLKSYIHYRGIKISDKEIKDSVNLPKIIKEQKEPLTIHQIHDILKIASFDKKSLYLCLLSSGMRIGESVQIKKCDTEIIGGRLTIKIPAKITKTKTGRTVYISKEATSTILGKRNRVTDDDLLWGTNTDATTAVLSDVTAFSRYIDKLGFTERYDSGTRKITLHSFRAFFFTRSARVHDENYAHMMTGHGGYLMEYDRLTDEEKLEMYLDLEPELLVYDQTKNEEKIRKLKEANTVVADQAEQLKQQEVRIKQLERLWFESKHPGIKNI